MTTGRADDQVEITEVGPRDGLQNQAVHVPTATKVRFVDDLSRAGFRQLEMASFVRQDRVPAMADAEQLFAAIERWPGVRYLALVPNMRGYERARAAGCDAIALFTAASEPFSRQNANCTIDESFARFAPVAAAAAADGVALRGYVSTIFACPYGGPTEPDTVVDVVERLLALGCYEVSLGDTIGVGTPGDTRQLLDSLLAELPVERLVMHFHDTWGMGAANLIASLDYGIRKFDASGGGLGGCPYAPDATGNVGTEDVLYLLDGMGYRTGIDIDQVVDAVDHLAQQLGYRLPGRTHNAMMAQRRRTAGGHRRGTVVTCGTSQPLTT